MKFGVVKLALLQHRHVFRRVCCHPPAAKLPCSLRPEFLNTVQKKKDKNDAASDEMCRSEESDLPDSCAFSVCICCQSPAGRLRLIANGPFLSRLNLPCS